jgi:hypothetical protein
MHLIKRALQAVVALTAVLTLHQPLWAQAPADLFTQYLTAMDNLNRVLAEVKNVDAAKANLPKVQAAVTQVAATKAQLAQLRLDPNNPQNAALMKEKGPQAQQVTAQLSQEITRVRTSPQIEQVLHDTLVKLP